MSGSAYTINLYVFVVPSSAVTYMFTTIDLPSIFISWYVASCSFSNVFIPTILDSASAIAPIVTLLVTLSKVYS